MTMVFWMVEILNQIVIAIKSLYSPVCLRQEMAWKALRSSSQVATCLHSAHLYTIQDGGYLPL